MSLVFGKHKKRGGLQRHKEEKEEDEMQNSLLGVAFATLPGGKRRQMGLASSIFLALWQKSSAFNNMHNSYK